MLAPLDTNIGTVSITETVESLEYIKIYCGSTDGLVELSGGVWLGLWQVHTMEIYNLVINLRA